MGPRHRSKVQSHAHGSRLSFPASWHQRSSLWPRFQTGPRAYPSSACQSSCLCQPAGMSACPSSRATRGLLGGPTSRRSSSPLDPARKEMSIVSHISELNQGDSGTHLSKKLLTVMVSEHEGLIGLFIVQGFQSFFLDSPVKNLKFTLKFKYIPVVIFVTAWK